MLYSRRWVVNLERVLDSREWVVDPRGWVVDFRERGVDLQRVDSYLQGWVVNLQGEGN